MNKMMMLTSLVLSIGCAGQTKHVGSSDDDPDETVCDEAPQIIHDYDDDSQPVGIEVPLLVDVITDQRDGCDLRVMVVELFFKQGTDENWSPAVQMEYIDGNQYRGSIPGANVGSASMRYFFKAVDSQQAETVDPPGADGKDNKAYSFGVTS